jgi:hypothetical protein
MRRSLLTFGTALAVMLLLLMMGAWGIGASLAAVGTVPANDNFADAEVLTTESGSVSGTNDGATYESGEDYGNAFQPPLETVWYAFTPTADGGVIVEITTADFDTMMGVYTGASISEATSSTRVAYSDDIGDSTLSRVDFSVSVGTTYHIQVDGKSDQEGSFVLEWRYLAAPENDDLASATQLSGSTGTLTDQHNYAATGETGEAEISGALESVWYFFTAPSDGMLRVEATDPDYFYLCGYTAASAVAYDTLTQVSAGMAAINIDVDQGETYWIQCDGDGGWQSTFTLDWSFNAAPSNDDFENATQLEGESGSVSGTTIAACEEPDEPLGYGNTPLNTVWYYWVAPADGQATFTMTSDDYYMGMALYDGGPGLAALNDVDTGYDYITLTVDGGTTYWIQVDGHSDYQGSFTLGWSFVYPPDNDDFADAAELTGDSGSVGGSNTAATVETDEPLPQAYNEASVWYVWTAPSNGLMELTMTDPDPTSLDTCLAVYTGTALGALTRVVSAGGGGTGSLSAASFPALAGTTYRIQIVGCYSYQEGSFTLDWVFTEAAAEVPVVTSADNASFAVGDYGSFTVTCTGSPIPSISIDWTAASAGLSFIDNGDGTATLSGTPATGKGGEYPFTILADNAYGSARQSFALTVSEAAEVVSQTWGPLSKPSGGTLTLSVTPRGYPAPTAQWECSTDNGATWTAIEGAAGCTYTTYPVTTAMNHYQYRCTLTNDWGFDSSEPVELLVYVPAGIVVQPTPQEAVVGSPATFTVQTQGEPAPAFQWQLSTSGGRKWADIPGATSGTYETPAASFAMDGYLYRVYVRNEWGQEWSAPVALTVRNASTDAAVTQQGVYDAATKMITWTWTVSNNGSETAQGLALKTTLANGTKFSAIDLDGVTAGTATSKVGGRNITVKLPDLAPGESATVSVTALVTRATGTVNNTVALSSTSSDPDLSNNTASGTVDVGAGI